MANLADLKRTPPTLQASVRISGRRRHSAPPSRGANAPEFCFVQGLPKIGGRRECRMQAAPVSLACKETALYARKQQQGSQINRHSLRDGLRLIRGLLGVPGFLATVALRNVSQDLTPASGDRDNTISLVRAGCFRRRAIRALSIPSVHRSPLPTSVTTAIRPSQRRRDARR